MPACTSAEPNTFWGAVVAAIWLVREIFIFITRRRTERQNQSTMDEQLERNTQMSEATPVGIKETKEVLEAVHEVSLFIIGRVKDGVGIDDGVALFDKIVSDGEFKSKMGAAIEKIKEVPGELKDLTMPEGIELAMGELMFLPKLLEALKKPA